MILCWWAVLKVWYVWKIASFLEDIGPSSRFSRGHSPRCQMPQGQRIFRVRKQAPLLMFAQWDSSCPESGLNMPESWSILRPMKQSAFSIGWGLQIEWCFKQSPMTVPTCSTGSRRGLGTAAVMGWCPGRISPVREKMSKLLSCQTKPVQTCQTMSKWSKLSHSNNNKAMADRPAVPPVLPRLSKEVFTTAPVWPQSARARDAQVLKSWEQPKTGKKSGNCPWIWP